MSVKRLREKAESGKNIEKICELLNIEELLDIEDEEEEIRGITTCGFMKRMEMMEKKMKKKRSQWPFMYLFEGVKRCIESGNINEWDCVEWNDSDDDYLTPLMKICISPIGKPSVDFTRQILNMPSLDLHRESCEHNITAFDFLMDNNYECNNFSCELEMILMFTQHRDFLPIHYCEIFKKCVDWLEEKKEDSLIESFLIELLKGFYELPDPNEARWRLRSHRGKTIFHFFVEMGKLHLLKPHAKKFCFKCTDLHNYFKDGRCNIEIINFIISHSGYCWQPNIYRNVFDEDEEKKIRNFIAIRIKTQKRMMKRCIEKWKINAFVSKSRKRIAFMRWRNRLYNPNSKFVARLAERFYENVAK